METWQEETVKRRAVTAPARPSPPPRRTWRQALQRWLSEDMHGERFTIWGAALLALVTATTILYYAATPAVIIDPDTATYLHFASNILHGLVVSGVRVPGYPVFIDLVFLIAGKGNLAAVAVAQAVIFIAAILALYTLGALIFRRAWIAFVPAALVGTNTYLMSYIKPIMSEALALFCVTALAVTLAYFTLRPTPRRLWLVAATLAVTFLTRPEWLYFPIPLLLFMLLIAWRAGAFRRLVSHTGGAVAAIYAVAGAYALGNKLGHGFFGLTDVQGINMLGKVMEYHLTGDAPPQYAAIDRLVASSVASGNTDPWRFMAQHPALSADHYQMMSRYAMAMILRHPLAFTLDCISTLFATLSSATAYRPLPPLGGPLAILRPLDAISQLTLSAMLIVLPIAVAWWALLLWPRAPRTPAVAIMSGLCLMVVYALLVTTVGGYTQFSRLHAPFDPLLFLVVAGSLALGGAALVRRLRAPAVRLR